MGLTKETSAKPRQAEGIPGQWREGNGAGVRPGGRGVDGVLDTYSASPGEDVIGMCSSIWEVVTDRMTGEPWPSPKE